MTDNSLKSLPPGSDKAIKAGCRCPVMDNHHGRGFRTDDKGEPLFWISGDCPIHNLQSEAESSK